jgi:hypothetical protein
MPDADSMRKVVVESVIRSKLGNLESELEFCDESGQTLGFFVPLPKAAPWHYEWIRAQCSDEELERARREPGGKTTAEVLAGLIARESRELEKPADETSGT